MDGRYRLLKVTCLLLSLITYSSGQAPIAFDDICQREQGIPDNLSCPRTDGTLQCYPRSELCNGGQSLCDGGSDEGANLNALDCDGTFTGRTTAPIAAFVCSAGVIVELEQLCDGVDNCGGGDDETTALCENKCLAPYYGSCPFSRECESTDLDLNCGLCRPGYARDPTNILGECLSALFGFSLTSYSVVENAGPLVGAVTLDTDGQIDQEIEVVIQTIAVGTATVTADYTTTVTTVTFPRFSGGGTTLQFNIPIVDDNLCESTETFQLSASIPNDIGNFTVGGDTATGAIIDEDACVVGFEEPTYTTMEGVVFQDVCLAVMGDDRLTGDVDVTISATEISGGSGNKAAASISADAALLTQSVTFGPSQLMRQCVSIRIESDTITEGQEVFQVNAQSSDIQSLTVQPSSAEVCIIGEEIEFEFSQVSYNVNEGDGFAQVCVDLVSGFLAGATPITLSPAAGSAIADNPDQFGCFDFTSAAQTVNFPAGTTPAGAGSQQCINVPINDDNCVEFSESFQVAASSSNPDVSFPTGNTANVNIADNDNPLFQFTSTSCVVNENAGPAQHGIQLSSNHVLTFPINVQVIDVAGGTATDSIDYTGISVSLPFVAGSNIGSQQMFDIPIINDILCEGQETILMQASVGAPGQFAAGQGQATTVICVIIDDDQCSVGFEFPKYNINEAVPMQEVCLVLRSGQLPVDAQVQVSTPANLDCAIAQPTVTFGAGSIRQCVQVQITDDLLKESLEICTVNAQSLGAQLGIEPGEGSADICITDDDLVQFEFNMTIYTVIEEGPAVLACVDQVAGQSSRELTVTVQSVAISATENMDYAAINRDLVFPANSPTGTQQCFVIPVIDDVVAEPLESFQLTGTVSDPNCPSPSPATVNIVDENDRVPIRLVPPPGLGTPNYTIPEQDGPLEVCVEIANPSGQTLLGKPVTVTFSTSDGAPGAINPADYNTVVQLITFNIGDEDNMMCLNIPIINDAICEDDETFMVSLSTTDDCVNILQPASGTATIVDDDVATIGPDQGILHYNVTERLDDSVWIPLRLFGQKGPGRECVVEVRTMDGTASAGMDYTSLVTTLTFDNANDFQTIHVDILDDTECEGHESFSVFLNTMSDGCNITDNEVIVWIWDDEVHFGDDPHFSIALPGGKLLCYTVQGEHGFSFNLINNEKIVMNSKFVPDARRSEVTWLGSMGIIVQDNQYKSSNHTSLRFEAQEKNIYIGDKVVLQAKNIERLTFANGKLTISEAPPSAGFRYPSVLVDLQDVEISFTIKFTNQHLDMYWHSTGKKITESHGLIGQFFRQGVEIDEIRKILIIPNKEPVPVMRRPVWAFMEREQTDDQLCWTAMNPGYQGEGLIDGSYFDYLVDDVMSTDFKYKKQ